MRDDGNDRGRLFEVIARIFIMCAIRRQAGRWPWLINITGHTQGAPTDPIDRAAHARYMADSSRAWLEAKR